MARSATAKSALLIALHFRDLPPRTSRHTDLLQGRTLRSSRANGVRCLVLPRSPRLPAAVAKLEAVGEIETLPVLNLIFFGPFAAVPCS